MKGKGMKGEGIKGGRSGGGGGAGGGDLAPLWLELHYTKKKGQRAEVGDSDYRMERGVCLRIN